MSAIMPPPSGRMPRLERVRDLLRVARTNLELSRDRLDRVIGYAGDVSADDADRMATRVLLAVRERECELWADEVARLEALIDALGVSR